MTEGSKDSRASDVLTRLVGQQPIIHTRLGLQ